MATRLQQGFSLVELLIVVSLLSLIAAIATPALFEEDVADVLERAAADVAAAFRTAQAEAIRTGKPHGVNANIFTQSIQVYRLDEAVSPAAVTYDVYHPVTKQLYALQYNNGGAVPAMSAVFFKFDGVFFPSAFMGFSGTTGVPKFNQMGSVRMLNTGYVRLSFDGQTRTISISPVTGRVTVQ